MTPTSTRARLLLAGVLLAATASTISAQVRLTDESDRAAFRSWFTLLADAQFEQPAPDVTDCAALVRLAFREALRAHTPEWSRRTALPFAPQFPDVKSAPRATPAGWPLFRVSDATPARFAEFADARTLIALNSVPLGRDIARARPGDLLYFQQPGQSQPDHLMVFVGRSFFEDEGDGLGRVSHRARRRRPRRGAQGAAVHAAPASVAALAAARLQSALRRRLPIAALHTP